MNKTFSTLRIIDVDKLSLSVYLMQDRQDCNSAEFENTPERLCHASNLAQQKWLRIDSRLFRVNGSIWV
jgi:hypothetical protein